MWFEKSALRGFASSVSHGERVHVSQEVQEAAARGHWTQQGATGAAAGAGGGSGDSADASQPRQPQHSQPQGGQGPFGGVYGYGGVSGAFAPASAYGFAQVPMSGQFVQPFHQFGMGQLGMGLAGAYLPTGKQPDWKHTPASGADTYAEEDGGAPPQQQQQQQPQQQQQQQVSQSHWYGSDESSKAASQMGDAG
jgi:hypothetical protein